MKKFLSLLCLAACVFSMTACSSDKLTVSNSSLGVDEALYREAIESDLSTLSMTSDADIIANMEQNSQYYSDVQINFFNSWMDTRSEVGDYIAVKDCVFNVTEDTVTITAYVDYSLRDATVKFIYDSDGTPSSATFNVQYTVGEKMERATLNTIIGISVVFVILIFISILIGCFKYISKAEEAIKNRKNKSKETAEAVDNTIAQIVQKEEEELVDDLELVAVISAAVAAYTGTSTDGFVVRSIRKSNKKRWQNA